MFRRRDCIAVGRIHHNDALCRRCWNMNIVNTNAGAANNFQIGCSVQDFGRDFCCRTDGKTIDISNRLKQSGRILPKCGFEHNFQTTFTEDVYGGFT